MTKTKKYTKLVACIFLLLTFCFYLVTWIKNIHYQNFKVKVSSQSCSFSVSPDPIQFGTLAAGRPMRKSFEITNLGNDACILEKLEISCACVRAINVPTEILPGHSARIELLFDPSEEPDFRGTLAIQILGMGKGGEVLFRTTAQATIISNNI